MKFQQSFCVVDSSLRILWIGGDWDDFARSNGGQAVLANNVLANKLTAYIADIETADLIETMVRAVIGTQRTLRMEYRCDAPHELRRFRLTIKPMRDSRAIMVHELRDALRLDPPMAAWSFDPVARARKCSICGLVHLPGQPWRDPTDPMADHPRQVTYTTCPACTERVSAALKGMAEGAEAVDIGEVPLRAEPGQSSSGSA